jgi:hypothetical protein
VKTIPPAEAQGADKTLPPEKSASQDSEGFDQEPEHKNKANRMPKVFPSI